MKKWFVLLISFFLISTAMSAPVQFSEVSLEKILNSQSFQKINTENLLEKKRDNAAYCLFRWTSDAKTSARKKDNVHGRRLEHHKNTDPGGTESKKVTAT